jgi:hypothetical protein
MQIASVPTNARWSTRPLQLFLLDLYATRQAHFVGSSVVRAAKDTKKSHRLSPLEITQLPRGWHEIEAVTRKNTLVGNRPELKGRFESRHGGKIGGSK